VAHHERVERLFRGLAHEVDHLVRAEDTRHEDRREPRARVVVAPKRIPVVRLQAAHSLFHESHNRRVLRRGRDLARRRLRFVPHSDPPVRLRPTKTRQWETRRYAAHRERTPTWYARATGPGLEQERRRSPLGTAGATVLPGGVPRPG